MGDDSENERELVERAKCDVQAFGLLYDKSYTKIFNYILRRTGNVNVSQDLTSEVFYKALNNIGKFKWQGIPFSAWLYRIATNEIANHYKKAKRNMLLNEDIVTITELAGDSVEIEQEQAETSLRKQQDLLSIHTIILKLPAQYQAAIALRYFEKKGLTEIAAILGKREGAVKSLLHRSLKKMRQIMEERETI
jgi:RNA polymerase sigma-70 factor (ECF subfamily)